MIYMGKFVAIGGGENGHHNTKYETAPFDKEIIKLTGKTNPNFLFIGLANSYPDYYFEVMDKIYNAMYGCNTDYLRYDDIKNQNTARSKIKIADIVYVGGGNTAKLMRLLRKYGIDKMLVEAYNDDKVLCGVSAGGICWCDWGNSDSEINSSKNRMIRVKGLGLIHILFAFAQGVALSPKSVRAERSRLRCRGEFILKRTIPSCRHSTKWLTLRYGHSDTWTILILSTVISSVSCSIIPPPPARQR